MTGAAVEVAALVLPVLAAAGALWLPLRRPAAVRATVPPPGRRQAGR